MKAILVIDWYETLSELEDKELLIYINGKDGNYISTEYAHLKPMPEKMKNDGVPEFRYQKGFRDGFNACIDEILSKNKQK